MRPLRTFEEFLEEGTITTRTPDIARAKSLKEEARKRMLFLKELNQKLGLTNNNANYFIENAYDILLELTRAKILGAGFKTSSHEAEVSYLRKMNFKENDILFLNDLRYFRNRILYYGKILDKEYAEKVIIFLNNIYPKLK